MAKRSSVPEFMLPHRRSDTPAYRWLYESLRMQILDGTLRPGSRLPSTRDLASQYRLSRGTVVNAFEYLSSEGYIEGSVGSGTYVSSILPETFLHAGHADGVRETRRRKHKSVVSDFARRVRPFPDLEARPPRAFRANVPALNLFPLSLWVQLTTRRLRNAPPDLLLGCSPMGYTPLREAIAAYLKTSRGVKCTAGQIMVVSGVQEAIDLVARILLNPGDQVCMEDPGYPGATRAFESFGARICPVKLDEEGMKLPDAGLRGSRLLYVTPAHQFPTGATMSLRRRLELLEWARAAGALMFEDDYDSEFRYEGRPVPALQGFDQTGQVLFAGTFSKVLFPSLRLGYLVIPDDLVRHFEAAKSIASRHMPLIEQAVLCDFITEGHFGRHLRHMREVYAERLSALREGAKKRLGGLLTISNIQAGLQTVGWLPEGVDGESAARAAAARHVEVIPLSRYCRRRMPEQGLQLGFAAVDMDEIRRGVRELAIALEHT